MKGHYVVMLKAVVMEQEGRESVAVVKHTREEAEAWIAAQKGEYFHPTDYYILEPAK